MPAPLTELERRILDFLVEYLRRNTYQPSIREIGRRFDIKSTKTVSELLQSLANKGWIERNPSRSRGVRLLGLEMSPATVTVPLYRDASVDAAPIDAFELDRRIAGGSGTFLETMNGNSLVGTAIRDGDLLLVEPLRASALQTGDIVLARLRGQKIIKRCLQRDGRTVLDAPDDEFDGITIEAGDDFTVYGRVIGLVRRLHVATDTAGEQPAEQRGS